MSRAQRFEELSDAEVLSLTPEQIDRYVDYECAIDGIPLLPPKPDPLPEFKKLETDLVAYEIAGLVVTSKEEALKIQTLVSELNLVRLDYDYGYTGSSGDKYVVPCTSIPQLETKQVYSKNLYDQIKDQLSEQKQIMEEHRTLSNTYENAERGRKDIVSTIRMVIKKAQQKQAKKQILREEWARYKDLAEGDVEIAYNFMVKIHKDLPDHEDLCEEFQVARLLQVE